MEVSGLERSEVDRIIAEQRVDIVFQPIVSMRGGSIMGVEALMRGRDGNGECLDPELVFRSAGPECLLDLDRLCRRLSLQQYRETFAEGSPWLLSLNFETAVLAEGVAGSGHLINTVRECGLDPGRIILEIVESKALDLDSLLQFVQTYRDLGFLIALDDIGVGHSNLDRFADLKPDLIKVHHSIIRDLHRRLHKQEVFRSLASLAHRLGAMVVAEGVETEAEAMLAMDLGADFLQGFFFARPGEVDGAEVGGRIQKAAAGFKDYRLRKDEFQKARDLRYEKIVSEVSRSLVQTPVSEFDRVLEAAVNKFSTAECMYLLDWRGAQVSETVFGDSFQGKSRKSIFSPSPPGADQSLKEYYLFIKAGKERYISEPYISMASGRRCVTISAPFDDPMLRKFILCMDFEVEAMARMEQAYLGLDGP